MCWVAVDVWVILLLQHGRVTFHLSTWFQRCLMLIQVDGFCPCLWSIALFVPRAHHPTVDGRDLIVTVANIWNSLPPSVTMSPAQYSFQLNLKTELSSLHDFVCRQLLLCHWLLLSLLSANIFYLWSQHFWSLMVKFHRFDFVLDKFLYFVRVLELSEV